MAARPDAAAAADEALRQEVEGWARAADARARQEALAAGLRAELDALRRAGGVVPGAVEAAAGSGAVHRAGTAARALVRGAPPRSRTEAPGDAAAEVRAARRRRRTAERRLARARREVARLTWRVRMRRLGRGFRPQAPALAAPRGSNVPGYPPEGGTRDVRRAVTWVVHGSRAELRARTRHPGVRVVEVRGGPAAALERARREDGLVLVGRPVAGEDPRWLSRLVAALDATGADAVTPVVRVGGRAVGGGRRFAWRDGAPEPVVETRPGPVPAADGTCLLMRAEAVRALPAACAWGLDATVALTAAGRRVAVADVVVHAAEPLAVHDDLLAFLGRWGPWLRRRAAAASEGDPVWAPPPEQLPGEAERLRATVERPSHAIRVAAPTWDAAEQGGDLQLARALAEALERAGHATHVEITGAPEPAAACCDVLVVLRGRHALARRPGQACVLWIISHPGDVTAAEIESADLVLAASRPHAAALDAAHATPVRPLLQFTDVRRFHPQPDPDRRHEVLFVGNWRSRLRPAVWHALRSGAEVALYGRGWDVIAPSRAVARWVDNAELPRLYSSCDVLLNDHWPDMRELGYLSNRLFDGLACGAAVLSDAVEGLEDELGDAVETYANGDELRERLAAPDPGRRERVEAGRRRVIERHDADTRARELLDLTLPLVGTASDPPMLSA